MVLGVQRDLGLALHQIDQLMRVLVGADFQLLAGMEPAERADHIFGAAELVVQNFRKLALTGSLVCGILLVSMKVSDISRQSFLFLDRSFTGVPCLQTSSGDSAWPRR